MSQQDAVGADDLALFADDSVDPVLARRLGASPGGIAMLSPAKRVQPLRAGSTTPAVPGSTKKPSARAFADMTNTPVSNCPKKRLFGPSATATPLSAVSDRPRRREVAAVATSPIAEHRVADQAVEELRAENQRLLKMYDFMRERAEDSEKARADVQAKLDTKIMEVMSLASRLDETKRLSKQLKAELREGKARGLPALNVPFAGPAPVEKKYEELLRQQRDEFHDELERQQSHCQDLLEDALDALQLAPSAVEALLSSLRERGGLQMELHEARKAKEDAESKCRALEDDLRMSRRHAAAEARRFRTLLANRDDLIDRLESLVRAMQAEDHGSGAGRFLHDDDEDDDADDAIGTDAAVHDDSWTAGPPQQDEYDDVTESR